MGTWVAVRVARDDRTGKQQRDLVVKREKSKTDEAQTTKVVWRYSNSRGRAGAACTAAYDDQNLAPSDRRVEIGETKTQRLAYARLGRCSGSRRRASAKHCGQCLHCFWVCFFEPLGLAKTPVIERVNCLVHPFRALMSPVSRVRLYCSNA